MNLVKVSRWTSLICILLALPLTAAQAKTHVVQQMNFTFVPADITIAVGDSVRWVWTSILHTVTSGAGPTDPNVGSIFDAPLDSTHPVFIHRFLTTGSFPYFCRFHFTMGMTGSITVQPATRAESASWGAIKTLYE